VLRASSVHGLLLHHHGLLLHHHWSWLLHHHWLHRWCHHSWLLNDGRCVYRCCLLWSGRSLVVFISRTCRSGSSAEEEPNSKNYTTATADTKNDECDENSSYSICKSFKININWRSLSIASRGVVAWDLFIVVEFDIDNSSFIS